MKFDAALKVEEHQIDRDLTESLQSTFFLMCDIFPQRRFSSCSP